MADAESNGENSEPIGALKVPTVKATVTRRAAGTSSIGARFVAPAPAPAPAVPAAKKPATVAATSAKKPAAAAAAAASAAL